MPAHLEDKDSGWGATVMRDLSKGDSIAIINRLRAKPVRKSCMHIPLCRLQPDPKVRPINEHDVKTLMNEFNHGYREGDRVM